MNTQRKLTVKTTEKLTKNIVITEAGEWLKTIIQKERDKCNQKVTKSIAEFNFLNSVSFPRLDKYAKLTEEEIRVRLGEFKSNHTAPISKEAKRFFSYCDSGRGEKQALLRALFPQVFYDRNIC